VKCQASFRDRRKYLCPDNVAPVIVLLVGNNASPSRNSALEMSGALIIGKIMSNSEVTFINVLDVQDGKQTEVVTILEDLTNAVISKQHGFITMSVFASKDGKRVINVAKWASAADLQAVQSNTDAAEYGKKLHGLATPQPGLYDEAGVFNA
jgi:heme-degrading monooxygenase HmoA